MKHAYTDEKNILILIALLKAHGIKKVIASPGTTNMTFIGSIMYDSWFEIYSCVDERSAAYMACGLAAESGEPVCLSCTGATASRNYIPGLTEAYYRKLPILALTATQHIGRVGQNVAQVIDRSSMQNDIVNYSCTLPFVNTEEDRWDCELKINYAILTLSRNGGGPAHINIQQNYSKNFNIEELPQVNKIQRYTYGDNFPEIPKGKIAIWIGNHKKMSENQIKNIDAFCEQYDAVVFCDHTSGYCGKFKLNAAITEQQLQNTKEVPDLLIYIGDVSGAYYGSAKNVWRVNEDGEFRDLFKAVRNVFAMQESYFFEYYAKKSKNKVQTQYYDNCKKNIDNIRKKIPELPFSNVWFAQQTASRIPEGSAIHFGILNSLRSWSFFDLPKNVEGFCNTGGFGIDGGLSSCIGSCLANPNRLHFLIIGDLAFFYDMNALGNRHVLNNLRILLVNNGRGVEFRNFNHPGAAFDNDADQFIAAAGHFGNQSKKLVNHYSTDLGFEYLSASNKDEYFLQLDKFLNPSISSTPILFEVFTNHEDESKALKIIMNLDIDVAGSTKQLAKKLLGDKGIKTMKKILGK